MNIAIEKISIVARNVGLKIMLIGLEGSLFAAASAGESLLFMVMAAAIPRRGSHVLLLRLL